MKTAQIHRFHNAVAIYVGGGETVYLTAAAADDIADALRACAENVRTQPSFAHSEFTTRAFVLEDGRNAEPPRSRRHTSFLSDPNGRLITWVAWDEFACTYCGRKAGERCKNSSGNMRSPHAARLAKASELSAQFRASGIEPNLKD